MVTVPIRQKSDIEAMKNYYLSAKKYRDYALFVMGINTALRISDLLALMWGDVYDFPRKEYLHHIYVTERKTQKYTCIALNPSCIEALTILMAYSNPKSESEYIFYSGHNQCKHISRNCAYHIIKKAAEANHIEGNISCHSLRKTFGYHAWKTGIPPALIMEIYNHSSIQITKRYLSINQDDKDELFLQLNL